MASDYSFDNVTLWAGVLIALVVIILSRVLWTIFRKLTKNDILILGLCDSGKSLLFSRLCLKKFSNTQTSIQTNTFALTLKNDQTVNIIDIPGYERLRKSLVEKHVGTAKGIIFVVDASTIQKDIRDVAEYLYNVLRDPLVNTSSFSLLIVCNKQDSSEAKGKILIKSLLEKELNIVRETASHRLDSIDNRAESAASLGDMNEPFEFSHVKTNVSFSEASFKSDSREASGLDQIEKWLTVV